jgi:DNA polymerase elongation subunit (family B)
MFDKSQEDLYNLLKSTTKALLTNNVNIDQIIKELYAFSTPNIENKMVKFIDNSIYNHSFNTRIISVSEIDIGKIYIDFRIHVKSGHGVFIDNQYNIYLCENLMVRDYGLIEYKEKHVVIPADNRDYKNIPLRAFKPLANSYMSYNYQTSTTMTLKYLSENNIKFDYQNNLDIVYYDIETANLVDQTKVPDVYDKNSILCCIAVEHISKHFDKPKLILYYLNAYIVDQELLASKYNGHDLIFKPCLSENMISYEFIAYLGEIHRPNIVAGFNSNSTVFDGKSIGYDLPFILERHPCRLEHDTVNYKFGNRSGKLIPTISILKYSYFVDMMNILYNALTPSIRNEMESFKLNEFLRVSKLELKKDNHGSYIDLQRTLLKRETNITDILEYCAYDTHCLSLLNKHFNGLDKLLSIGQLLNLPLYNCLFSTQAKNTELYLNNLFVQNNYLISYTSIDTKEPYQGAYCFLNQDAILKVSENVADADFSSLFPSLIIDKNISLDTLYQEANDHTIAYNIRDEMLPSKVKTVYFTDPKIRIGLIPKLLINLKNRRKQIKDSMSRTSKESPDYTNLDSQQYAVKILMNALYGLIGSRSSVYSLDCVMTCTYFARESAKETQAWYKRKYNKDPLLIDTDSIMAQFDSESDIQELVNHMKSISPNLVLAIEPAFKYYMPTSSKKSYIGLNAENELLIKGLSWSLYSLKARDEIRELFLNLLKSKPDNLTQYIKVYYQKCYNAIKNALNLPNWRDLIKPYCLLYKISGKNLVSKKLRELYNSDSETLEVIYINSTKKCKVADIAFWLYDLSITPNQLNIHKILQQYFSSIYKMTTKIIVKNDSIVDEIHYRTELYNFGIVTQKRDQSCSVDDFINMIVDKRGNLIENNNLSIHEVFKCTQKYRFFLDLDYTDYETANIIMSLLTSILGADIQWYHTVGRERSFHCISNIAMDLSEMKNILHYFTTVYPKYASCIDLAVYAHNRSLRYVTCPKINLMTNKIDLNNRHQPTHFSKSTLKKYIISNLDNTIEIDLYRFSSTLPYIINSYSDLTKITPELFELIKLKMETFLDENPLNISVSHYNDNYLSIKPNKDCILCGFKHENASYYAMYSADSDNIILKCWANKLESSIIKCDFNSKKVVKEDAPVKFDHIKNLNKLQDLIKSDDVDIESINSQGDLLIDIPSSRMVFLDSNMGTGKTNLVLKYINTLNPDSSVLMLSFRRTFSDSMATRLNLTNYQEIKGSIDTLTHNRVLIQIDSLYRLKMIKPIDLLIIDETCSIIEQLESFLNKNQISSYQILANLLRQSNKIICMDGLLSRQIASVFNSVADSMYDFTYIKNDFIREYKHIDLSISNSNDKLLKAVIYSINEQLNINESSKICAYITSLNNSIKLYDHLKKIYPNINILLINSDELSLQDSNLSIDLKRKYMKKPNEIYNDYQIFIHSGSLSAGVSVESHTIDLHVSLYSKNTNMPIDFTQGLFRCRSVLKYKMYYAPGSTHDSLKPYDVYKGIYEDNYAGLTRIMNLMILSRVFCNQQRGDRDYLFLYYLNRSGFIIDSIRDVLEYPLELTSSPRIDIFDLYNIKYKLTDDDLAFYNRYKQKKCVAEEDYILIKSNTKAIFELCILLELTKMTLNELYDLKPEAFKKTYTHRFQNRRIANLLEYYNVDALENIDSKLLQEEQANIKSILVNVDQANLQLDQSVTNPVKSAEQIKCINLVKVLKSNDLTNLTKKDLDTLLEKNGLNQFISRYTRGNVNKYIAQVNYQLRETSKMINGVKTKVYVLAEL